MSAYYRHIGIPSTFRAGSFVVRFMICFFIFKRLRGLPWPLPFKTPWQTFLPAFIFSMEKSVRIGDFVKLESGQEGCSAADRLYQSGWVVEEVNEVMKNRDALVMDLYTSFAQKRDIGSQVRLQAW